MFNVSEQWRDKEEVFFDSKRNNLYKINKFKNQDYIKDIDEL